MRTATLTRKPPTEGGNHGILGRLVSDSGLTLAVVERPWVDKDGDGRDDAAESCIQPAPGKPPVKYRCRWTKSPRLGHNTYELQEMVGDDGREGVRIHSANLYQQLRGCLAPGLTVAQFPAGFEYAKGAKLEAPQMGVSKSVGALAMLEQDMRDPRTGEQVEFELTICWAAA